jgi:hypothetical protein
MLVFGGAGEESCGWDVLAVGGSVPPGGFGEARAGWWRRWTAGQCGLALTVRVLDRIDGAYGACGSAREARERLEQRFASGPAVRRMETQAAGVAG